MHLFPSSSHLQEPELDGDRSDQVDVEASQVDEELIQNLTQQTPSQWSK